MTSIFHTKPIYLLSRYISNFFNPIVSLLIFFVYLSKTRLTYEESFSYIIPILLIIILPIIFWIVYNVKKGKYSNADVSDRIQRKTLYRFVLGALGVYLAYYYAIHKQLDYKIFYLLILLILMNFSNYFIKSSMHTGLNVFAAGLFYAENSMMGFIWLILAGIVGITRIILKRHSVSEVLSGGGIALFVSVLYLSVQV